jgi:hypothetical protein
MIGQQSGIQEQLFFCFSLENHIPKDHLLRGINHFLDLGDFRQQLAEYYSPIDCPRTDDPHVNSRLLFWHSVRTHVCVKKCMSTWLIVGFANWI